MIIIYLCSVVLFLVEQSSASSYSYDTYGYDYNYNYGENNNDEKIITPSFISPYKEDKVEWSKGNEFERIEFSPIKAKEFEKMKEKNLIRTLGEKRLEFEFWQSKLSGLEGNVPIFRQLLDQQRYLTRLGDMVENRKSNDIKETEDIRYMSEKLTKQKGEYRILDQQQAITESKLLENKLKLDTLEKGYVEKEKELKKIHNKVDEIDGRINSAKNKFEERESLFKKSKLRSRVLEHILNEVLTNNMPLQSYLDDILEQEKFLKRDVRLLNHKIDDTESTIAIYNEVSKFTTRAASMKNISLLDDKITEKRSILARLKREQQSLETVFYNQIGKKQSLKDELVLLQSELSSLRQSNEISQKQLVAIEREMEKLNDIHLTSSKSIYTADQSIETLKSFVKKLLTEFMADTSTYNEKRIELKNKMAELAKLIYTITNLKMSMTEEQKSIDILLSTLQNSLITDNLKIEEIVVGHMSKEELALLELSLAKELELQLGMVKLITKDIQEDHKSLEHLTLPSDLSDTAAIKKAFEEVQPYKKHDILKNMVKSELAADNLFKSVDMFVKYRNILGKILPHYFPDKLSTCNEILVQETVAKAEFDTKFVEPTGYKYLAVLKDDGTDNGFDLTKFNTAMKPGGKGKALQTEYTKLEESNIFVYTKNYNGLKSDCRFTDLGTVLKLVDMRLKFMSDNYDYALDIAKAAQIGDSAVAWTDVVADTSDAQNKDLEMGLRAQLLKFIRNDQLESPRCSRFQNIVSFAHNDEVPPSTVGQYPSMSAEKVLTDYIKVTAGVEQAAESE
ncbi:hypothetical protein SNEBB_003806 [Seison nebaliae]|nr:hypothetical protein SNEBB_003806 [Seison nebaliae]